MQIFLLLIPTPYPLDCLISVDILTKSPIPNIFIQPRQILLMQLIILNDNIPCYLLTQMMSKIILAIHLFLMQKRIIQMQFILKFGYIILLDIEQGIGCTCRPFQIDNNLFLLYKFGIDIESVPLLIIPTVSPIVTANRISSVDKNVHQMVLFVSALDLI